MEEEKRELIVTESQEVATKEELKGQGEVTETFQMQKFLLNLDPFSPEIEQAIMRREKVMPQIIDRITTKLSTGLANYFYFDWNFLGSGSKARGLGRRGIEFVGQQLGLTYMVREYPSRENDEPVWVFEVLVIDKVSKNFFPRTAKSRSTLHFTPKPTNAEGQPKKPDDIQKEIQRAYSSLYNAALTRAVRVALEHAIESIFTSTTIAELSDLAISAAIDNMRKEGDRASRAAKMFSSFAGVGVTKAQVLAKIGMAEQLFLANSRFDELMLVLRSAYTSIKTGEAEPSDIFDELRIFGKGEDDEPSVSAVEKLREENKPEKLKKGRKAKPNNAVETTKNPDTGEDKGDTEKSSETEAEGLKTVAPTSFPLADCDACCENKECVENPFGTIGEMVCETCATADGIECDKCGKSLFVAAGEDSQEPLVEQSGAGWLCKACRDAK